MPGGLLNIIAYGNQNIILNGNPKKTFFKVVYSKYTNFGIQKFRIDYKGSREIDPNTETIYTFNIPRNAELLLDSYFVFTIPDVWSTILPPIAPGDVWKPYHFKWINNLGTSAIKQIRFMIGSQVIQQYPGEYLRCVSERDFSEEKKKMFDIMIGNIEELNRPEFYGGNRYNNYPNAFYTPNIAGPEPSIRGRKIYVPLNPWYMNNSKLALPLVALQYSEVTIEVTLRPIRELITINNIGTLEEDISNIEKDYDEKLENLYQRIQPIFTNERHELYRFFQPPPTIELTEEDYKNKETTWNADAHLLCNYCFLTTEESQSFAYNEQQYLIKDIKYDIFYNIVGTKRIKIDTNALVSSWMWFYRRSDAFKRNEWGNYTNWKTKYIPYELNDGETETPYSLGEDNQVGIGPGRDLDIDGIQKIPTNHKVTPTYNMQYRRSILENFSIIIDGKYRENEMDSGVYNYIEKFRSTKSSMDNGVYNYNFCINTGDYLQPTGAINLSRFKYIEFEMTTVIPEVDPETQVLTLCDENGGIIGITKPQPVYLYTYEMHLFEERYNVLRFMSGNGGLLFAR
jgi:hypothetical protein